MEINMSAKEWYGHTVSTVTINGQTFIPFPEFSDYNHRMIQRIKVLESLIKELQEAKREEKNPDQLEMELE